jgi:hypothetical protein
VNADKAGSIEEIRVAAGDGVSAARCRGGH